LGRCGRCERICGAYAFRLPRYRGASISSRNVPPRRSTR
jgi:hypothetical protein